MITIEQIKTAISDNAPDINIDDIPQDAKLKDNDIDSLDFFNIVLDLQTLSGIDEIPDEDIDQLDTINSIYKYFEDK